MAADAVDRLVEVAGLEDREGCRTDGFLLDRGEGWQLISFIRLVQDHGIGACVRACVHCKLAIVRGYLEISWVQLHWSCPMHQPRVFGCPHSPAEGHVSPPAST